MYTFFWSLLFLLFSSICFFFLLSCFFFFLPRFFWEGGTKILPRCKSVLAVVRVKMRVSMKRLVMRVSACVSPVRVVVCLCVCSCLWVLVSFFFCLFYVLLFGFALWRFGALGDGARVNSAVTILHTMCTSFLSLQAMASSKEDLPDRQHPEPCKICQRVS